MSESLQKVCGVVRRAATAVHDALPAIFLLMKRACRKMWVPLTNTALLPALGALGRRRRPNCMEKLRGYDRRPTEEEATGPPDQRPWTEYDGHGNKQPKPPFKALSIGACLCSGPTCCVFELQWPEWLCNWPSFEPGDCDGWEVYFEVRCSQ